ncbi:hypothetical protein CDL15_Pgr016101 [Punica granatum]|uniref:Uncharacterized protein n=1 Tax=Punica granatum TaxID=22663 RepID=A0A218X047_PUNGR|nr:hypothetical protein CDL15_Pgr016101 [Punica granatum]
MASGQVQSNQVVPGQMAQGPSKLPVRRKQQRSSYEALVHKEKAQAAKGYGVTIGTETGITFVHVRQYQAHIRGLNAYDRHKKFLNDYVSFYGKDKDARVSLPVKTDQDTLREGYRFIRTEEDDKDSSWEQRLVKRYYDKLFKEYPFLGTKRVIYGQFVCGNKHCDETYGLASYEASVNFSYFEAGESKQALVKLLACEREQSRSDDSDCEGEESDERSRKGKDAPSVSGSRKADDKDDFDKYLQGMFP